GRRGHALEYAARQIEFGLVAWAEKAAQPVGPEICRRNVRPECRRAAEMRADADGDEYFGLARAVLVLGVRRLVIDAGFGIGDLVVELRQARQHRRRPVDDPDDFAAPFDIDLLA